MCHNLHQRLQSQSLHLSSRYHHFHGFNAVPGHGLNTIQFKWTNVQSRSQEVQDAIDVIAVHVTVVDIPGHVMPPDFQAVPIQSPFDPTLHVIAKYHISEMNFVNVMIILIYLPPIDLNLGTTSTTTNLQPPTKSDYHDHSTYHDYSSTKKWKPWQSWKDQSKPQYHTHPSGWVDYSKPYHKHQSYDEPPSKYPSKPLTAFSLEQHSHHHGKHPNRSGSAQSRASTLPPGHIPINLQEGSKEDWARQVKHALTHPDRMRAANELDAKELPQPSTSIIQEHCEEAMEELAKVDSRIPTDIGRKAIYLLSSTGILTDFDLSTCYVRELPQTGMLALVMPLPEISRFSMPRPFGGQTLITWALGHGTTISTSQLILMEGKIRPANWTYHKNPHRCGMPSFGAFYLGRQIANADKTIPSWAELELLDSMEKKGKGQQEITIGAIYRGAVEHLSFRAGGNEKCQINVAKKGIVNTPERYTIAHSNHVGLKFIAIKWSDLDDDNLTRRPVDLRDTDSEENVNYRDNEERHAAKHRR